MVDDYNNHNSLKKHYKGEFLIYLRNFLECYFVPGYQFNELPRLINEYKKNEPNSLLEGLQRELTLINEKGDWDYVQQFVKTYGMRLLPHDKLKTMVDLIINELTSTK